MRTALLTETSRYGILVQRTNLYSNIDLVTVPHLLQPENLLSAGEEEHEIVKIADFGFSKSFAEEGEKLMTSCGSPGYVGKRNPSL